MQLTVSKFVGLLRPVSFEIAFQYKRILNVSIILIIRSRAFFSIFFMTNRDLYIYLKEKMLTIMPAGHIYPRTVVKQDLTSHQQGLLMETKPDLESFLGWEG